MSLVKLAVGRDHLGFKPDAELHSKLVYFVNEVLQAAVYLLFVYEPVAERAVVGISVTEPAIVHNEHLNAEL